ncbi:MAG: galactokinase [Clostridia bacterium]|nr:galactokinase [Clostridia bacterium]
MRADELRKIIEDGGLDKYVELYADISAQKSRFIAAIDAFEERYGEGRELFLFSVPGRSEIIGNHTDHNRGAVMAGAIDRDIIAVASPSDEGVIRLLSRGYDEDRVALQDIPFPDRFENYSSASLIAGVANAFSEAGYKVGGFDAYTTSDVLKGSGISSSAAYEVMIGNIINHLYAGGEVDNKRIAMFAQRAENMYFGKPCGLMDQMACAVGGFVYIDFADPKVPLVVPVDFSLSASGYALCIVNTGGNHANLNEDYASIPTEMRAVAACFGKEVLRGITERDVVEKTTELRTMVGDRSILRALHFIRENDRVVAARDALLHSDINGFLGIIRASGESSFKYLQNVYTNINVHEQGLSLALALTDGFLGDKGALRVHGGGFAGTIQVFLPKDMLDSYVALMDSVFGAGATMVLSVRPAGAVRLF